MVDVDYVSAVGSVIAALLGYLNHKTAQEIHILVNSKFTEALARIVSLEDELKELKTRNETIITQALTGEKK
jgi:hypothetical protein